MAALKIFYKDKQMEYVIFTANVIIDGGIVHNPYKIFDTMQSCISYVSEAYENAKVTSADDTGVAWTSDWASQSIKCTLSKVYTY